jgi:threonine synthase
VPAGNVTGTGSLLTVLECRACCAQVDPSHPVGTCPTCGHALFASYDLARIDGRRWRREWDRRDRSLWRYRELLPVQRPEAIATLGEGGTPILPLGPVGTALDVAVSVKDDGTMPTGSFKARGMAVAVSRARELGLRSLFVPSAGNAGLALSAYAARARLHARIYLPEATPPALRVACESYGAEVVAVPGTIREAGETARRTETAPGSFDMSTLREPYRLEGKKTMGFEIFDALGPEAMPEAIVYPTGGGTGLVGMAKAFAELRTLGLLERSPRLYAVQPEGCAPVVRALRDGESKVRPADRPHTLAPGLLVPAPFASERILEAVRSTNGGGATVTDAEIVAAMRALAVQHGLSASPEAAAPYAALPRLLADHALRPGERVLLYHTGTGIGFSIPELERQLESAARRD